MSLYEITKAASQTVDAKSIVPYKRTVDSVLASTMSELGETAVEVMIHNGQSYKQKGRDGIVGEAVDTILCLLDLIHVVDPSITEEQINEIARAKCAKWVYKTTEP